MSSCCSASIVEWLESKICSECLEHCEDEIHDEMQKEINNVCDECGYYEDTTHLHFDDCSKLEKMGLRNE